MIYSDCVLEQQIGEKKYSENMGVELAFGVYNYGAPEVDANWEIMQIRSDSDMTVDSSETDEDGTIIIKYHTDLYGGRDYEKRFLNDHMVYYKVHQDSAQTAVGWVEDATTINEYTYDDDGNLIYHREQDKDGSVYADYFIYNSDGDIVAIIADDGDDGILDGPYGIICHSKEYDEDGNLIRHEMIYSSECFYMDEESESDYDIIMDTPLEEMSDVCSHISEKYCGNIDEDYIEDKYLETWEYKTLSEIKSLEAHEEK